MSCNNWEEGFVKFSVKEWAPFRTAIIEKVNELREKKYKLACEAYKAAQEAGKGRRGFSRADWVQDSERFWEVAHYITCLLYTSPSPRDQRGSRMPSSA